MMTTHDGVAKSQYLSLVVGLSLPAKSVRLAARILLNHFVSVLIK